MTCISELGFNPNCVFVGVRLCRRISQATLRVAQESGAKVKAECCSTVAAVFCGGRLKLLDIAFSFHRGTVAGAMANPQGLGCLPACRLSGWTTYGSPRLTRLAGPTRFQSATEFRTACRFSRINENFEGAHGSAAKIDSRICVRVLWQY